MTALTTVLTAACGAGNDAMHAPPTMPTPPSTPPLVTANAYILPNAVTLGPLAFGEPPLVVYKGERLRWINVDTVTHALVADTPDATDFVETNALGPAGERSLIMTRTGTTRFHCSIHPEMVGTLVVRER
jgi:plastocyanin